MDLTLSRLLLSLFALVAVASISRAADSEDDTLAAYFRSFLDQELKERPAEATRLGDHRYDNKLEDLSAAARAKWDARYRAALAELPKKVQYKKLSRSSQIDYEILEHH